MDTATLPPTTKDRTAHRKLLRQERTTADEINARVKFLSEQPFTEAEAKEWASRIRSEPITNTITTAVSQDLEAQRQRIISKMPMLDDFCVAFQRFCDQLPTEEALQSAAAHHNPINSELLSTAKQIREKARGFNNVRSYINAMTRTDENELKPDAREYLQSGFEEDLRDIRKDLGLVAHSQKAGLSQFQLKEKTYSDRGIINAARELQRAYDVLMVEFDHLDYSQVDPAAEAPRNLRIDLINHADAGSFHMRELSRKIAGPVAPQKS